MRCHFEDRTLQNIRHVNEMIKSQRIHKTNFLRQFGIHTNSWNDWVSGKQKGPITSNQEKLSALFCEFGL
jgi:hypothetical protein